MLLLFVFACSYTLLASPPKDWSSKEEADSFIRVSVSALAPVYGYLAAYLTSRLSLESRKGIGVDIGGGPGQLAVELARRSPRMSWIDMDINPHFFPFLARVADSAGVGGRVKGLEADAVKLPLPDNYAAVVVSRGSYQFWDDLEQGLAEVYRILAPGGVAFIGRGFAPDMPPEAARRVREAQGGGPKYDPAVEAEKLRGVMERLGIEDFEIVQPKPRGADDINFGIWLQFQKASAMSGKRQAYVMDTLVLQAKPPHDPLTRPKSEPVGLQSATTEVTAEEISRRGSSTLIEALEYVPGAWVESRGRKVKQFFSVRGQRYPYPDYALDGAWQREFHELPYFFPASDIEKVEVMRSSAALLNGLAGINGVVDITLRRLDRGETIVAAEYGSFGSYDLNVSHGNTIGPAGYTFSAGIPGTQGPGGRNADESVKHLRGSFYWNPSAAWSVTAHVMHLDGHREVANALAPAGNRFRTAVEAYDPFRASLVTIKTTYAPGAKSTSEMTLNFSDRDHTYVNKATDPYTTNSEHDYEWSANFIQSVALSPANVLRFGGLYNHWVAPEGKRFYTGRRCDLETLSMVAVDQHKFGRLTVEGGLRWAKTLINQYGAFNIDGSASGFSKVEPIVDQWEPAVVTANAGAVYDLNRGFSLLINVSNGKIKPRSGELDTDHNIPRNEQRTKLDFGFTAAGPGLAWLSVTGFYVRQDDAIVLSGQTDTIEGRVLELYLNRDQDQLGVELEARSAVVSGKFQLFGNLTLMRSRAEKEGQMVSNDEMPDFISSAGLYFADRNLDATVLWKYCSSYSSSRFTASGMPEPLGDFHDLGVTAGYTFGRRPVTRIYAEIRNAGDDHYSTVVGWPDYGRRYTLGVRTTFY